MNKKDASDLKNNNKKMTHIKILNLLNQLSISL